MQSCAGAGSRPQAVYNNVRRKTEGGAGERLAGARRRPRSVRARPPARTVMSFFLASDVVMAGGTLWFWRPHAAAERCHQLSTHTTVPPVHACSSFIAAAFSTTPPPHASTRTEAAPVPGSSDSAALAVPASAVLKISSSFARKAGQPFAATKSRQDTPTAASRVASRSSNGRPSS